VPPDEPVICDDAFNTFFSENGAGKHVPRGVCLGPEPTWSMKCVPEPSASFPPGVDHQWRGRRREQPMPRRLHSGQGGH
jgi:hypothetical protein